MPAGEFHGIDDVLDDVRLRRQIIAKDDLGELASFLSGYSLALQIHGVDEDFALDPAGPFTNWLSWNFGTSLSHGWEAAVESLKHEGESSVEAFFRLLGEFRENPLVLPPGE
ncbi:hypothetical protein [Kitasatospora sp. NPDC058218]|uniref:hypothetical protein n=1 Tax=Kitasatospora sp. NPDC058218 TaxID=3346385 RepID=UPI0036D97589